jgi:cell division protein FtsB
MSHSQQPPAPQGLLVRGLKLLGHLTHPETRTGKVFTRVEQRLTHAVARVTESPSYLRVSGTLMRQGLNTRIRRNRLLERTLRTLRLPTPSEMDGLRDQVRRMGDQVEALNTQLEVVAELLQEKQTAAPEPRARKRASSSRGA